MTLRLTAGLLLATGLWLTPGRATAQVVVVIEGGSPNKIARQLVTVVPEELQALDPTSFISAMSRNSFLTDPKKPKEREALIKAVIAAGKKVGAPLVVVATVESGGRVLRVLAVRSDTGETALDKPFNFRQLKTKGRKRRRKKVLGPMQLGPVKQALEPIMKAAAAASNEEIVAAAAEPVVVSPEEEELRKAAVAKWLGQYEPRLRFSGLSGELRFFVVGRKLSFLRRGNLLRGYRADAITMLGANAEFYPGALFNIEAIDWLGAGFRFAAALGLTSASPENPENRIETTFWTVEGDLRPRLSFGPVTLTAAVGIGSTSFEFLAQAGSGLVGQTPGVSYFYFRGGVEALVNIHPVSFFGGGAYLHNFSTGTLDSYFTSDTSLGFTVNAGIGVQILDWLEARAAFDYTQIGHDLTPATNSPYVAVSATDHFYGGRIGVVAFYPR